MMPISFSVRAGELHCLLGENGAGKSTLSACLYGLLRPDAGTIRLDGAVRNYRSPRDAIADGIGMVHQHFTLVGAFTGVENILVSAETRDRRTAERRIEALAADLGLALDLHRPVNQLSVGEQQWIEILAALFGDARLLILDEPTAVLTPQESAELFAMIRHLCARGVSVILISHKLDEVLRCDRITVIRRGRVVATVDAQATTKEELAAMMVGRAVSLVAARPEAAPSRVPMLEVRGLTVKGRRGFALDAVSFTVHRGEILGIAAVAGNGQDELFEALVGVRPAEPGAEIILDGTLVSGLSPTAIAAEGVGYVPSDRYRDGLVAEFTVAENLLLGRQNEPAFRRGPFLRFDAVATGGGGLGRRLRHPHRDDRRAGADPFRRQRPEADPRPRAAARHQVPPLQPADPRPRCRRHRICPPADHRAAGGGLRRPPRERGARGSGDARRPHHGSLPGHGHGNRRCGHHRPSDARPDDGRPEGGEPGSMTIQAAPIRGFKIVRREAGRWFWLRTFLLAAIGSILVTALLFAIAGADILSGFEALIVGSVGSKRAVVETLTRATPLILTGVGTAVAYRARIWNIGAEGQLFAGAMAAYWATLQVSAPLALTVPIALVAGFAGGALYAGFAGWLKVRFAVQEVISTVLLNYIILFALSLLLLDGPWSDPGSFYQRTPVLPETTWFPLLVERSHLHIGFLVALIAAVVVEVMITRTAFGFELRAFGYNPNVLALKGTSSDRLLLIVMAISGGLCGLAGVGEVYGVHHRLLEGISPGLGYCRNHDRGAGGPQSAWRGCRRDPLRRTRQRLDHAAREGRRAIGPQRDDPGRRAHHVRQRRGALGLHRAEVGQCGLNS